MKITLSKIAGGLLPSLASSKVAKPGSNGLYGKNPEEKTNIATGISKLEINVAQLHGITAILLRTRDESDQLGTWNRPGLKVLNARRKVSFSKSKGREEETK